MLRPVCGRLTAAEALSKLGRKPINRKRPAANKHLAAMAGGIAGFLSDMAPLVADQLAELLGLVEKARRKPGGSQEAIADAAVRASKALDDLVLGEEWLALVSVAEKPLTEMAADGVLAALQQIGVTANEVQVLAGDKSATWARSRAAEMVGMRRNAAGDLVPNPNAEFRIDETTRVLLRESVEKALIEGQSADELKAALIDDWAFSAERAETIARTEIAKADMVGAMEGYRASGLVAGKIWSTSEDDLVSEACNENKAAGILSVDAAFPSGDDAPPEHPNCRCSVLPVLIDEMPSGKNTKDVTMTKLYAAIEKADKQDDGTLKVYGFASSEIVDSDGETVTADAMKAAREGYMAFANVREMHDPKKAAGVAIEYDVQDDGRTWFGAHVVDPIAVLKVETGVYKGFSIGARVPAGGREGKIIKAIDLREVSLVDRPANPEAVFTMFKADGGDDAENGAGAATDLKKGLYELGDFAGVLRAIGSLAGSAEFEAQMEGDLSPLPAALRDWLAQGVGIFKAMAEEETTELLAQLNASATQTAALGVIAAADAGGAVTKAGSRFSAATKAMLKAAHEACKAADKALADLKYDADAEVEGDAEVGEQGKAATAGDLEKAAAADAEQVAEIAKAAGLDLPAPTAEALAKAALAELLVLRKTHADLLARPAPPKGAVRAVEKAADRGTEDKEPAPVVKSDGAVDDVATLIKAAQARPIRVS